MSFLLLPWRHILRRRPVSKILSRNLTSIIPDGTIVEEETLPYYEPQHFYPVHIGDVYASKYQVIGKLGYGAYSTVWLCRDLRKDEYIALKVSTSVRRFPEATKRESKIYEHLSTITSTHPGQSAIRDVYDTFELQGLSGPHQCLLQPPMHMSLLEMMKMNPEPFNLPLLKMTLKRLFTALDFLHTEAEVIHTDLKTDNIMLTIDDRTMLELFEKAETEQPSPRKPIDTSRTIYRSRKFPKPKQSEYGLPVLCDFGEARIGRSQNSGPFVQPHIYRAPEVIFEMPWGPPVDIWNVACLIWDLFEGEHLFSRTFDPKGHYDPFQHLAQIVSFIGPPPIEFLKRSETTDQCFDASGNWVAEQHVKVPTSTLEDAERRLQGEEKKLFLGFLRLMLRWLPEERKTANQLLQDPWLKD